MAYELMMDTINNAKIANYWDFINGKNSNRTEREQFIGRLLKELSKNMDDDKIKIVGDLIFNERALPVDPNNFKLWCTKTGNYKYIPAVFALLEKGVKSNENQQIDVYTTGSWGSSLKTAAKDLSLEINILNVIDINNLPPKEQFKKLRMNIFNTDLLGGALGTFFVCMAMPKPELLKSKNRRILPRINQGNLLSSLITMGYEIGCDIVLETAK